MTDTPQNDIDQLVEELGGKDAVQRRKTSAKLVETGSAAVLPLLDALDSPQQHAIWRSCAHLLFANCCGINNIFVEPRVQTIDR